MDTKIRITFFEMKIATLFYLDYLLMTFFIFGILFLVINPIATLIKQGVVSKSHGLKWFGFSIEGLKYLCWISVPLYKPVLYH